MLKLFLYGSLLKNSEEEAADLYVYRLAELKAVQIGHVSRVLKKVSVDCLLNLEQMGFSVAEINQTVEQRLVEWKDNSCIGLETNHTHLHATIWRSVPTRVSQT